MDPITGLVAAKAIQEVTNTVEQVSEPQQGSQGGDFDAMLKSMLSPDAANNINEEELFAALIHERVATLKGEEAAAEYQKAFESSKQANTRADGYVNVEQAANDALSGLVGQGLLTEEEAGKVRSDSFAAAQLDDKHDVLYDGRGSGDDPTIAVMEMEAALLQARTTLQQLESGEIVSELTDPSTETTDASGTESSLGTEGNEMISPEGTTIDGEGGFLFKPESDRGELVVLLPSGLADQVMSVVLRDAEGNEIEQGVSSGYANPDVGGEREHFRFSQPGSEYPENVTVAVTLADGSVKEYSIPNPSERYD